MKARESDSRLPLRWLLGERPRAWWIVNVVALAILGGAILCDAQTTRILENLLADSPSARHVLPTELRGRPPQVIRVCLLMGAAVAAAASGLALLVGAVIGPRPHRRLGAWLMDVGLLCLWLALVVGWRDASWTGRRLRTASLVSALEPVAERLRRDWPAVDGDYPETGPFMAYPAAAPATLVMLAPPPIGATKSVVQLVERSPEGALHFQLGGAEQGVWLVWTPPGAEPASSFLGGLDQRYQLLRSSSVGDGWQAAIYEVKAGGGRRP